MLDTSALKNTLLNLLTRVEGGERPVDIVASVVDAIQTGDTLQAGQKPLPEAPDVLKAWKAPVPHAEPTFPDLKPGFSHVWERLMTAIYSSLKEALAALDKVMKNRKQKFPYPDGTFAYLCQECENCCFLVRVRGSDAQGYFFEVTGHPPSCQPSHAKKRCMHARTRECAFVFLRAPALVHVLVCARARALLCVRACVLVCVHEHLHA